MNVLELDRIYNEDCLEGMKRIPDASIDCIICDLPYGTTKNSWDSVIPLDKLWEQYKRIIKERGAVVLFAQSPFDKVLGASNLDMLKYEWIWEKSNATGFLNSKFAPMKIHENILIFSKSAACFVKDKDDAMVYIPQFRQGTAYSTKKQTIGSKNYDYKNCKPCKTENDGLHYYPIDILTFKSETNTIHPTQKPVALIQYLIKTYSNEGDLILDNCMGSGTTAIAAIREKRHFVGFELNAEYFQKATQRIELELSQPSLF